MGFLDTAAAVEAEPRIDFRRNAVGNDFQDFDPKLDCQLIHRGTDQCVRTAGFLLRRGKRAIDDRLKLVHLRCLKNQAGVRRGVSWLILADALEIAGVGHDHTALSDQIHFS